MRKYYILTILLTHCQLLAAEPIAQLITKLDTINNISCEEMTSIELSEHCTRELCGPPGSKASSMTAKNINKFITPTMENELKVIEGNVARLYDKKRKETEDLIAQLEKRMSDPKFSSTEKWDEVDYSYMSNMFWKFLDWNIDGSKPLKDRSEIKLKDINIEQALIPGINEFIKEYNKNIYNDPVQAYKLGLYDLEEMKSMMGEKANKLQTSLSAQKSQISFAAKDFKTSLSQLEEEEQVLAEFKKLEDLASENGIILIANESNCKENCKQSLDYFVKNIGFENVIANLKTDLSDMDVKDKIAECKASYIKENQQNNLSKNFDQIWPEVKSSYLKNVLPRFSSHSQKMMKDYLENDVHFYFDNPSYSQFPNLEEMYNEKVKPLSEHDAFLIGDLTANYFDEEINLFKADMTICDPYSSPSLIWDSFLANENILPMSSFQNSSYDKSKDNIAVSPFTCEHHNEGSGILAHELGHAMSNLMKREGMSESSLKDYRELRKCATKQWDLSGDANYPLHPDDKQFTEEDSADILSYMAVNDGKSLYACGFMDVSKDESSYQDFSTEGWGSHSPSLIRLIREMNYKRPHSIPKSCELLARKNQDKLGDKKCF